MLSSLSAFAWVPGVNPAGPEEKTLLIIADLLDDLGFIGKLHGANRLLADGGRGPQKRGCSVLDQVCLTRIRIAPALRSITMNNGQDFFVLCNARALLLCQSHNFFRRGRNESFIGVLNSPVSQFA